MNFSVSGNKLTITATTAPSDTVSITATKSQKRAGIIVWSDGNIGGGHQDTITYSASVSDPVKAFLNVKVSYGSAKIIKTSEDSKVDGIKFTVVGEGVNQTVTTNSKGVIQIDNLMPGTYTVTEQTYDKYVPQETHRVTVIAGQTATVSFNNVLRRGDLTVTKTSEDGIVEGVKFHLYGTSVSGLAVDEYAITNSKGVATFKDVLIGSGYTLEEVDTAIRYVVPASQSAAVEWNSVTNKSFSNILKKFNVTVTKSDKETGTAQGDASLAGATYGIYKGDQLVDTYVTDKNGQFTTSYYVCGDDWSIKEIEPSEGYLLDTAAYHVGAEAKLYTVERNSAPAIDVTEQVQKGNIAIIKHTDDGETKIETPEEGAVFAIYLKSSGSFDAAKDTERDYLTCDENGFAQSKDMFNLDHPKGYKGRSLSVSDVVEVIGADGESTYHFCDTIGFQKVNFDPDLTEELKEEKIKVVLCEPGKVARVTEITNTLDGLQAAVKGDIEAFYPFEEAVCIVCNEEGKFNGMDPNRAVYGENHEIMDVIFGPFFICDCSGQNFGSLDREQLERFRKQFRNPERLISVNGKILSVPYNPQQEQSREGR